MFAKPGRTCPESGQFDWRNYTTQQPTIFWKKKKIWKGGQEKVDLFIIYDHFFTAELLAWIVSRIGSLSSAKHKSDHLCQRPNSHSNIM